MSREYTTLETLQYQIRICRIHYEYLSLAIQKIAHLYPFNSKNVIDIDDLSIAYLELFTSRLGKLQDTLGEKVFSLVLESLGENVQNKSTIDKLNKLEQLEILPSVQWWQDLRKLRNVLVHEYPDNPAFIADNLNSAFTQAKRLLAFWESIQVYIHNKILG